MRNLFTQFNNVTVEALPRLVRQYIPTLQSTTDNKVLRKLLAVTLYEAFSEREVVFKTEGIQLYELRKDSLQSMDSLYATYMDAWVQQDQPKLQRIRQQLNSFAVRSQNFRSMRYIHSAAIDLKDWKTAALLSAKFSSNQFELQWIAIKPGSERTLRMLRLKMERSFKQCTPSEELDGLFEALSAPTPEENANPLNQLSYVLRYFLGDFYHETIYSRQRRNSHPNQTSRYFLDSSQYFRCMSSTRKALFQKIGTEPQGTDNNTQIRLNRWVDLLCESSAPTVRAFASRALSVVELTPEHKSKLVQTAVQKNDANIAVLVLLQSGFIHERVPNPKDYRHENHYSIDRSVFDITDAVPLLNICLSQPQSSVCQIRIPELALAEYPEVFFELLSGLLQQSRFDFVLQTIQKMSFDSVLNNVDTVVSAWVEYKDNVSFATSMSTILHNHFQGVLYQVSPTELLSYLQMPSNIVSKDNKQDTINQRMLTAGVTTELLEWFDSSSKSNLQKVFDQYLGRFTNKELSQYQEALFTYAFADSELFAQRFDVWQEYYVTAMPNFAEKMVYTWFGLPTTNFLKHADRFWPARNKKRVSLQSTSASPTSSLTLEVQQMLQRPSEKLFQILGSRITTHQTVRVDVIKESDDLILDLIEVVPRSTLFLSGLMPLLLDHERNQSILQRVVGWISDSVLSNPQDSQTMGLFDLAIEGRIHAKMFRVLDALYDTVWSNWYMHTTHKSWVVNDYHTGHDWLLEKVLQVMPLEQVAELVGNTNNHAQRILTSHNTTIQQKLRPFLTEMTNHTHYVPQLLAGVKQTLDFDEGTSVLLLHLLNVPAIREVTQTALQPVILGHISQAFVHDKGRGNFADIVEIYLIQIPLQDVLHDDRLILVMQSERRKSREYGYQWMAEHVMSSPEKFIELFFTQIAFVRTCNVKTLDSHMLLLKPLAQSNEAVLLMQTARITGLMRELLINWEYAKTTQVQTLSAVVLSLALKIPSTTLQADFAEELCQLIAAPVPNLLPFVNHLISDDLLPSLSAEFVSFVEGASFVTDAQEQFALSLIETVFHEPLLLSIQSNPKQHIAMVKKLLASGKSLLQSLGETLLGLFPARLVVEDVEFGMWLLTEARKETLNSTVEYLEEVASQDTSSMKGLAKELFEYLSRYKDLERFEDVFERLLSVFYPVLSSFKPQATIVKWTETQEERAPLSRLHLYLFGLLSGKKRQKFSATVCHLLSIPDASEFAQRSSLLEDFSDLEDIFDMLFTAGKRPKFLQLRTDNIRHFLTMYPSDFEAYMTKQSAQFISMLVEFKPTQVNNQKLLGAVLQVLPPWWVREDKVVLQKMLLNGHLMAIDGYQAFLDFVFTDTFVEIPEQFASFLATVRSAFKYQGQDSMTLMLTLTGILERRFVPMHTQVSKLPTSSDLLHEIVDTLGRNADVDKVLLGIISQNPTASLVPLSQLHSLLIEGRTEVLQQSASTLLSRLIKADSQVAATISQMVIGDLRKFAKQSPVSHVLNLLQNVFKDSLLQQQNEHPQRGIKFIDETLLNLPDEQYHQFGMELMAELSIDNIKQHGQYVLLKAFDHKSGGVREGVKVVFAKIWDEDPTWSMSLLLRLLVDILPKAKRPDLFDLLTTYISRLQKENSLVVLQDAVKDRSSEVSAVVREMLLNPAHQDSVITQARFSLGKQLLVCLPAQIFAKHIDLNVFLILHHDSSLRQIGETLVDSNLLVLGDTYRRDLGNALMQELKSDQKYVAEGANIFNFHFYPTNPTSMPTNLNGYQLLRKTHQFPDFDGGLLPAPNNPKILIGPQVDDRNIKATIGFSFNYCNKEYRDCVVDSNGWLKFEGSFSGSTYANNTSYQQNNSSMLFIWWQDLRTAHDGYLRTWMTGDPGQRVRVFEWRVWAVYTQSKSDNRTLNLQICLYEGSNRIEYRFGSLEPRGKTNQSRTATCGAKVGKNRTSVGNFRDFFGQNGNPKGSQAPFRSDLKSDGNAKSIDYPGVVRDAAAEAHFDKVVLARYTRAMSVLETHCQNVLSTLDLNEVSHLIHHPKVEIRNFGGRVIKGHSLTPDNFPSQLLLELLLVQDKNLQKVARDVFGRLTITGYQNHRGLWIRLLSHSVNSLQGKAHYYLTQVLDFDTTYHLDILKTLFAVCNPKPVGQLFVGQQQSIFERTIGEAPIQQLVQEHRLLQSAYFSTHPQMTQYFHNALHQAIQVSRTVAFSVWDKLLQLTTSGQATELQKKDLPIVTKLIEVHIANIQPDDLRDEGWWVPRLLSPNDTVQATLGLLLGRYAEGVPRNATQIARNILDAMNKEVQVYVGESAEVVIPYDVLTGRVAIESFCEKFPKAEQIHYTHFWLRMFMHLHPEIRNRGKVQLLQQLTDSVPEKHSKIVLDALVRQLRRDEPYVHAHRDVISFIGQNIASRLHLIEARLLRNLLDSRVETVCDFGLTLMRQKYSPERVKMLDVLDLSSHTYVKVRQYAHELMVAKVEALKTEFGVVVNLLESDWEDTRVAAWLLVEQHLMSDWTIDNIIRVCDSVKLEVRELGLSALAKFLLGRDVQLLAQGQTGTSHDNDSQAIDVTAEITAIPWGQVDHDKLVDITERLSQHPTMDVERFLMKIFAEHQKHSQTEPLLQQPEQLEMMIPFFKRIFSRVNKARGVKEMVWNLLESRSLDSVTHAKIVYPLLSWLAGSHLKTDQFRSIALMARLQQHYDGLSVGQQVSRLEFTPIRTSVQSAK